MKTIGLEVGNYCVACHAACRYCLLASARRATGVDDQRARAFALRIHREIREQFPGMGFDYYIGYCMDMPDLPGYVRFSREHGYPAGRFLQMNGCAFRNAEEWDRRMRGIREAGAEMIDLTFFGTREYHDRFAGYPGDHDHLKVMLGAALRAGLQVNISVPLIRENLAQADALYDDLSAHQPTGIMFFLPHSKGRGRTIADQRITKAEFDALSPAVREHFQKTPVRPEAEWVRAGQFEDYQARRLMLILNEEEMPGLEQMSAGEIIRFLENMDDEYLAAMPRAAELARIYGDPDGNRMYRLRDLQLEWEQRYIRDTGNRIRDMHDETHHFCVHQ